MPQAAVLVVGDEILQGHTLDTNTQFLARRLHASAVELARVVTVPDAESEIAAELRRLLVLGYDFIFVCGGIGPTPDDRTYEGVAIALERPLMVDPEDEAWLRSRTRRARYASHLWDSDQGREALVRMVRRPEGTQRLENPVGLALGTAAHLDPSWVFVLPGVPGELRAMFDHAVAPRLSAHAKRSSYESTVDVRVPEAVLYPVLRALEGRFPNVRFGSYPQRGRRVVRVRASGPRDDVRSALKRVQQFATDARHAGSARKSTRSNPSGLATARSFPRFGTHITDETYARPVKHVAARKKKKAKKPARRKTTRKKTTKRRRR